MKKELQERLACCVHEFAAVVAAIYAEPDGQDYVAESACIAAPGSILLANIGLSYTSDSKNTKDKVYPSVIDCSIGSFAASGKTFKLAVYSDWRVDKPEDFNWSKVKTEEISSGASNISIDSGTFEETKYVGK